MDELTKGIFNVLDNFENQKNKKCVAILFADMTASSYMNFQYHNLDAWRNVIIHNEICRNKIATHGGIVIKYIGDGVMGRFNLGDSNVTVDNVLQCALEIQKEIINKKYFETKIGINICKEGEALEINGDDLIGFSVDIASRINEMAEASQILVSENVIELLKTKNSQFSLSDFNAPINRSIRGMDINIDIYEFGLDIDGKIKYRGVKSEDKIKSLEDIQRSVIKVKTDMLDLLDKKIDYINRFFEYNIIDILPPSSLLESKTKEIIDRYITDYLRRPGKKKKIRAYGIALRKIFQPDGVFKRIILESHYPKGQFEFQAIILDPNSDAAKTRGIVEGARECIDFVPEKCTVYTDIQSSIKSIQHIKDFFSPQQFKVKISKMLPQMWFLMTEEVLFFEQYHIGRSEGTTSYQCLGGSVPVIQTGNRSYWYEYFNNQFEFLWSIKENDPINDFFGMKEI